MQVSAKKWRGNWHNGPGMQKVYLACRSDVKAQAAKQELERQTGKRIFEIVLMEVSDLGSVRAALKSLDKGSRRKTDNRVRLYF
ncbi:MAG: hypothetical protein M3Y72_27375 [Acidobacteriota bacterium]|nr:hypothetical protein [Acidobacteriota bacterium]